VGWDPKVAKVKELKNLRPYEYAPGPGIPERNQKGEVVRMEEEMKAEPQGISSVMPIKAAFP
jgi:hypothetical protein